MHFQRLKFREAQVLVVPAAWAQIGLKGNAPEKDPEVDLQDLKVGMKRKVF